MFLTQLSKNVAAAKILEKPGDEISRKSRRWNLRKSWLSNLGNPGDEFLMLKFLENSGDEILKNLSDEILENPGDEILENLGNDVLENPGGEFLEKPAGKKLKKPGDEMLRSQGGKKWITNNMVRLWASNF